LTSDSIATTPMLGAVLLQKAFGRRRGGPVHHPPEHREQPCLEAGDQRAQEDQRSDVVAQALGARPHEREKAGRRVRRFGFGIGLQQSFEKAKQGATPEHHIIADG
jgi:hypothetical protein